MSSWQMTHNLYLGLLEEEANQAEPKSKADSSTSKTAKVVELLVDRPVHVVPDDVRGKDTPVHHGNSDRPRFLIRCIRDEAIAPNEKDDIGAKKCGKVFQPEELNIELFEEINVENHRETDEEEAKVREHYQKLSSSPVAPWSQKQGKDHRWDLKKKNEICFRFPL